ncbi:MAG TPA: YqgE/AlgH family protein [Ignavibacteria bacterium]|nr:YqgE/AlgH family protein [Ignavibacteria bacterium]
MKPDKGKILISAPFLNDTFKRSVIYLTEHNENGTVGFIINKKLNINLSEIVDDFPDIDTNLYMGGPVQQEILNVIHRLGDIIEDSFKVQDGIYWGGNYEQIKSLINTGVIKKDDMIFFLGYSGWSAEQLEGEIKQKSWIVTDIDEEKLFSENDKSLWSGLLREMGGEYKILSTYPEDPIVN